MKLVVLGASGGCGRELVAQGDARGHAVTAVARERSKVTAPSAVRVLRGDLTSTAFLREAVRGSDAVLSGLGLKLPGLAPWRRPEDPTFLDRSTGAIVAAMKAEGVRRVVAISAGGVRNSHGDMPYAFKLFLRATSLRVAYEALARMEEIYLASGLDVCLVRPTGLTDAPATHRAEVVPWVVGRAQIPRADVAEWMLDEVARPSIEQQTPLLTVTGAP